jgi:putative peptidoglycan lipid II flippase
VWGILAGSAVGLLASTLGRLYSSTYYALRDTRTPLRYAVVRVILTTMLGYFCAIVLPPWLGVPALWGAAGLTASAGLAGWVELLMLRHRMNKWIGPTGLRVGYVMKLWTAAGAAASVAWLIKREASSLHPVIVGVVVLVPYLMTFLGTALALRIPIALRR